MSEQARFVVAAGGYRTGSTLQYNLCGTYVEALGIGRRLGLVDPDSVDDMLAEYGSVDGFVGVAKSHHVADGFGRFRAPTRWADLVVEGRAIPIASTRDEGDQRRSMQRKFKLAADELESSSYWIENAVNTRRWAELGAFQQTYEELTRRPLEALRALARHLSLDWDHVAATDAVRACTIDRTWESLPFIDEGEYDPVTLIHWDHVSERELRDLGRGLAD